MGRFSGFAGLDLAVFALFQASKGRFSGKGEQKTYVFTSFPIYTTAKYLIIRIYKSRAGVYVLSSRGWREEVRFAWSHARVIARACSRVRAARARALYMFAHACRDWAGIRFPMGHLETLDILDTPQCGHKKSPVWATGQCNKVKVYE